jgi:hypothetical protein
VSRLFASGLFVSRLFPSRLSASRQRLRILCEPLKTQFHRDMRAFFWRPVGSVQAVLHSLRGGACGLLDLSWACRPVTVCEFFVWLSILGRPCLRVSGLPDFCRGLWTPVYYSKGLLPSRVLLVLGFTHWVPEGSLAVFFAGRFQGFFGQTWPRDPSRSPGLGLQLNLHQKSKPEILSKAIR